MGMLQRGANNNCKVVLRWIPENKIERHSRIIWWKNRKEKGQEEIL